MKNNCIEISCNDRKKSLPDVACNSAENNFFVVWAAVPGEESQTADNFIYGQKISSLGEALGEPVEVLKTEDMLMLPRVLYNPNKNQYLVIYCLGEELFQYSGRHSGCGRQGCRGALQGNRCACKPVSLHHGIQFQKKSVFHNLQRLQGRRQ